MTLSHFTPLHMMNQELVTIPSTLTSYWIHPLPHLEFWSTSPLEHNLHLLPLLAQCAADMVTCQLNVSGMAQEFVLTATKLDAPYIIVTSSDVTNNNSTLICCAV